MDQTQPLQRNTEGPSSLSPGWPPFSVLGLLICQVGTHAALDTWRMTPVSGTLWVAPDVGHAAPRGTAKLCYLSFSACKAQVTVAETVTRAVAAGPWLPREFHSLCPFACGPCWQKAPLWWPRPGLLVGRWFWITQLCPSRRGRRQGQERDSEEAELCQEGRGDDTARLALKMEEGACARKVGDLRKLGQTRTGVPTASALPQPVTTRFWPGETPF